MRRDTEGDQRDPTIPCPLALVVVKTPRGVLFGLNRWRKEFELPGGMIDDGETARVAAARELAEETGLLREPVALHWEGTVLFRLTWPNRDERAAVFSVELSEAFEPIVNEELTAFLWWTSGGPSEEVNALDLAIAEWVST